MAKESQRLESIQTIEKSALMARLDATTVNIEDKSVVRSMKAMAPSNIGQHELAVSSEVS